MKHDRRFFLPLIFLSVFLSWNVLLSADEQGWNNNSAGFTLARNLSLKLSNEVRNRELTFMNPYLKNWQGGIGVKLPANFTAAIYYKRENSEKNDFLLAENRYTLEAGWKTELFPDWELDLRFRTEIRHYDQDLAADHLRFRFRVRLKTRLTIGSLKWTPFIASEPFSDTLDDTVNRHRFYLGTNVILSRNVELVAGYIRQDTKGKEVVHIFNTGIELKF